jgi:FAD/FMN-containing dehydrogenase
MPDDYASWGRHPKLPQRAVRLNWRSAGWPTVAAPALPRGNGRSYGDSCLSDGGTLLDARGLDRFIAFDAVAGRLACESGVLLGDILDLVLPKGWFLPVVPGTRLVTVGGAIANDIHGKNHHARGSFGNHVTSLELLRSDGRRIVCGPTKEPEWFAATVGGLGLTGLITRAELQLIPVAGPWLEVETIRFANLDAFFALAAEADRSHEYTVAWIDCLARGRYLGRGLFYRATHAPDPNNGRIPPPSRTVRIPIAPPVSVFNAATLRPLNALYYLRPRPRRTVQHYLPYFFPLDSTLEWNRLYGPLGFLQHQCVVPHPAAPTSVAAILDEVATSGTGSLLAVLKTFGTVASRGWLSFPRPGTTLALDFPFRGQETLALLDRIDRIVMAAGGRVYPAKDARMSGDVFRQSFPRWVEVEAMRDPGIASAFWRRVTADAARTH